MTVPTEYGNRSLFLVVCIRDDRTKLLASVGFAQARPNHLMQTKNILFNNKKYNFSDEKSMIRKYLDNDKNMRM